MSFLCIYARNRKYFWRHNVHQSNKRCGKDNFHFQFPIYPRCRRRRRVLSISRYFTITTMHIADDKIFCMRLFIFLLKRNSRAYMWNCNIRKKNPLLQQKKALYINERCWMAKKMCTLSWSKCCVHAKQIYCGISPLCAV